MTALAVALGGAIGACLRAAIYVAVDRHFRSDFPHGTYLVNAAGSLLLGLVAAAAATGGASAETQALIGVGFCGSLTTFASFSYSGWSLLLEGRTAHFLAHVGANLVLSFAAAWLGLALGG